MNTIRNSAECIVAGLDVGSLATKAVLLSNGSILASRIDPTGANPRSAGERALDWILSDAGKNRLQLSYIIGTGYGRINLPFANRTVTELTCHAKGAYFLYPEARTVIDIGGQDSKVIHLDANGNMVDFAMNDKCAAGTGRFLEVMANALELSMHGMSEGALQSPNPCPITNTCAVFAESEVVSLLASGHSKADVAAGLHRAIAQRVGTLAMRLGLNREVVFAGGVAKNLAVRKAMENFLEISFLPEIGDPQLNGALGAAVLAQEIFSAQMDQPKRPAMPNARV